MIVSAFQYDIYHVSRFDLSAKNYTNQQNLACFAISNYSFKEQNF